MCSIHHHEGEHLKCKIYRYVIKNKKLHFMSSTSFRQICRKTNIKHNKTVLGPCGTYLVFVYSVWKFDFFDVRKIWKQCTELGAWRVSNDLKCVSGCRLSFISWWRRRAKVRGRRGWCCERCFFFCPFTIANLYPELSFFTLAYTQYLCQRLEGFSRFLKNGRNTQVSWCRLHLQNYTYLNHYQADDKSFCNTRSTKQYWQINMHCNGK